MHCARWAVVILVAAICSPAVFAQASPKASLPTGTTASARAVAVVAFEADLARDASAGRSLKAGGIAWTCTTTHCTGSGPGNDPAGACNALVAQVGALKDFSAAGHALDMNSCPAPMSIKSPTAMRAAPAATAAAAAPAPAPAPKASAAPGGRSVSGTMIAPTDAGANATIRLFTPIAFTAKAITLTGTGASTTVAPFTPIAFTAKAITLTGTGAATTAAPFTPIAFTAKTITLTGTGNP